jgi:putative transposase
MKETYPKVSLKTICGLFGKTRQGWYHLVDHKDKKVFKLNLALEMVHKIRKDLSKTGGLKLHFMIKPELQMHHFSMGRDSLFSLLRANHLLIKPKRRRPLTTNSAHEFRKWPDLVKRRAAIMPEEIWVSDITYLHRKNGFYYLDLITDLYSRKIVGYNLSHNLKAASCLKALKMAVNSRLYPSRPLIHHSDRGIQYCCDAYIKALENNKFAISMTQDGSPYDNAVAERVNGILKGEMGLYETFDTFQAASKKVDEAVRKYNEIRPHLSCNMETPMHRHAAVNNNPKMHPDNNA